MTSEYLKIPKDKRGLIVSLILERLDHRRESLEFFQSRGDEEMVTRLKADIAEAEALLKLVKTA